MTIGRMNDRTSDDKMDNDRTQSDDDRTVER